jgi:hypothetical protein
VKFHKLATAFVLVAAGATATAQDDGLRPLDPDKIEDLGGWLGEETAPAPSSPPAASQDQDPLAGPAPAAKPQAKQELTPEERARRENQIQRNYDEAQNIYQGIIRGDKVGNIDRRIANNERIVKEFTARIRSALKERRDLQVQVFNRSFYLKQQVDRGQLTQEVYDRMIAEEERKYEERVADLKKNVIEWRKEVASAKQRVEELKAERRTMVAAQPRRRRGKSSKGKQAPKAKPGEKLLTSLRARLRQLSNFETKHTLNGVHPRDLGTRPVMTTPVDGAALVGEDDDEFWEEDAE